MEAFLKWRVKKALIEQCASILENEAHYSKLINKAIEAGKKNSDSELIEMANNLKKEYAINRAITLEILEQNNEDG